MGTQPSDRERVGHVRENPACIGGEAEDRAKKVHFSLRVKPEWKSRITL